MDSVVNNNEFNYISSKIIGAAIEVHKIMGPGLFESVYEECLCYELDSLGLGFERQKIMPVTYKGKIFDNGFRTDILVESKVIVELKSVNSILPVHEAQLLNYLKLADLNLGLLINFNVLKLTDGLNRVINGTL